jgi:hypothetical protein
MIDIWTFLSDSANQATLTWLGGAITVAAGGAWAVIRYFVTQPGSQQAAEPSRSTVHAEGSGIAAGRDVRLRSSRGISGSQTILLLLVAVGGLVLIAGLAGDRIAAVGSSVVGGDVENSTIMVGPQPQGPKP